MDLRKLINSKAMLQHEINKAKEGYQALLQSMQDLKVEEKVQQEKVQKLQKPCMKGWPMEKKSQRARS